MQAHQVEINHLVRHKRGKLYRIDSWARYQPNINKGDYTVIENPAHTHVWATQWQINDRHPEGRRYQAARLLAIVDLIPERELA